MSAFACIGSTCLLATQADGPAMPIEGQFVDVDGNPMGARFTIGTFFDPGANFRLAADGTQFRLIVSDQTASPDVRMLSVGIHLDGTLGPVLDLLPSSISTDCVRLTCAPARCLAVSALWNPEGGSGAALYRTRIDGETVLDTAPFLIPAANAQFSPVIGSDGTNVMVSWLDMRAAGDAPTTSLRATPWSPTSGWATASTTDVTNWDAQLRDFTNPGIRAVAWDGARYITAWKENDARHIDVAWFALDGSPPQQVTVDVPAWDVRSVSGIACVTSACFIGTYASDNQLRLLRVDGGTGAITVRSGVALGRNEVRAFSGEIIAIGERFDQVVLARFTTDGALISDTVIDDSYPINHSYPAEPALRTTVVGNHLLVVWQSGTQLVGRTISSTFETSSPVVLRTDPSFVSSWAFTTVGDTALLVSHHYAEPLIYGQRLTEDLTLVDAVPFVIAETSSSLVDRLAASLVSADSAIVVWSGMSLDPAILNERLRLVTVTAPD